MQVPIYFYNFEVKDNHLVYSLTPTHLGYAEVDKFDADELFNLCNWGHWTDTKPENLNSNIFSCGHGLLLENPETGEKWLAKSQGWIVGDDETITKYIEEHQSAIWWG